MIRPLTTAAKPLYVYGEDSSTVRVPAVQLVQGVPGRAVEGQAARLAHQFLRQNEGVLHTFCADANVDFDGNDVYLSFVTNTRVGAVPLLSPTSGRPDIGLVVRPRFEWLGIGAMLGEMGWRVVPQPLKLPLLPGSERRIPPWVLSTIVLARMQALLDRLELRFEMTSDVTAVPRGTVDWQRYATVQMPRLRMLEVPSRFPDLLDNRELKAAIHYTLRKQQSSLETQRNAGPFVAQLVVLCQLLIDKVRSVHPKPPTGAQYQAWNRQPLSTDAFRQGIEAIEWTADDRGLAGVADLNGLPWMLNMEDFFEAWLEMIVAKAAHHLGGTLKAGRRHETTVPLQWSPPYHGSQRSLMPDLILETRTETIIFDAKYKRHWEELQATGWWRLNEQIQEQHRQDLLQVLAYSTVKNAARIVSCLVYPCSLATWESLQRRNRAYYHARVPVADRHVEVMLTALPMSANSAEATQFVVDMLTATRDRM